MRFKSKYLASLLYDIDDDMSDMEDTIRKQEEEIQELRKENGERLNASLQAGNAMMANTLMACISQPDIESLGPVGATMIARIKDMNDISQVREYINDFLKKNKVN